MTGEVVVTNVAPGTPMSVEFTTTQTGYAPGTGTATETSIVGDARVPEFVNVQRLATGFTAQIDNFGDGFSFTVDSIDPRELGTALAIPVCSQSRVLQQDRKPPSRSRPRSRATTTVQLPD